MLDAFIKGEIEALNACWRAAHYLSIGQIYLYDNPLLREPLKLIVIEGVSLINNCRPQFRETLANKPPESLLKTLKKKVGKA